MPGFSHHGTAREASGPFGLPNRGHPDRRIDVNRVRFPVGGGKVVYTAISEFSASFTAAKAADGDTGTEWATLTANPAGAWWQVTFAIPQAFSLIILSDRTSAGDHFGSAGVISFSDGTSVAYSGLANNGTPLPVGFNRKTGIRWFRITTDGGSGVNPIGLREVEGY